MFLIYRQDVCVKNILSKKSKKPPLCYYSYSSRENIWLGKCNENTVSKDNAQNIFILAKI